MSDVKELDAATSNWESAVDMDAAMIAAMRTPAMKLGNSCLAKVMNTIFCAPTVSSSSARNILPKYAIRQVHPSAHTTQMIATVTLLYHRRFFDGHESYQNMRHAEVSQTPGKTRDDFLPGGVKYAASEAAFHHLSTGRILIGIDRRKSGCIQILGDDDHDRHCHERSEHQQSLGKSQSSKPL